MVELGFKTKSTQLNSARHGQVSENQRKGAILKTVSAKKKFSCINFKDLGFIQRFLNWAVSSLADIKEL